MKKLVIAFILLINYNIQSQEVCKKMIVKNDEVTETTVISSEEFELNNFSLSIIAGTRKGSYPKIIFKIKNECIDEYQPIYIVFTNDEKIKTANYVYNYNCDGFSGLIINNANSKKLLNTEKIKTIRVDTRKNYYQIDLTNEQAESIKSVIQCAFDRKSWESQIKYKANW